MIMLFLNHKTQDKADRAGDHPFLVRMNDTERDPAGSCGNHALTGRVSLFFEFDSKEFQPIANPGADRGAAFPDATSEAPNVSSPSNAAAKCADPFLDLVAPLIVRMPGLAGFMDDSFVILQSERSQCLARGLVIHVTDAANPQTFRDLDEQRLVIDIDDLVGWHLGDAAWSAQVHPRSCEKRDRPTHARSGRARPSAGQPRRYA